MAITVGLSGNGGTLPDSNENDLWLRSTSSQNPLEWELQASGETITFRLYWSNTDYVEIPVADGESKRIGATIHNYWFKVTAQGTTAGTPTWFPTILGT